jgi:DnaJ domain
MMRAPTEAFPLTWPAGWRRETARTRAAFGSKTFVDRGLDSEGKRMGWYGKERLSINQGTQRVIACLKRMGFEDSVVVSSNLALRLDGLPRSGQGEPKDPGVAVYWGRGQKARCMAVDRYDRVADNLGAIAATLEAMRAIERHGGAAILDRAFTGFIALPAPEQPFQVLGVGANASATEIEDAYRRLAAIHHPDKGGNQQEMARINAARDAMLQDRRAT